MMRYMALFLLGLTLLITSCKKEKNKAPIPGGTYTGTFQRTGGPVANITLTFSGNSWNGQSPVDKYPALCEGVYHVLNSGKLDIEQTCLWTADFDWSFIFDGEYEFRAEGGTLEIKRTYNNGLSDLYRLTRQ